MIFDPKKSWPRLGLGWISEKRAMMVKKFLDYLVLGMFMDKVKKFCEPSLILWEMAGDLLTSGSFWTPPASFRVKVQRADLTCHVIRNSLRLCCVDQSGTSIQILLEPCDTFLIKLRLYCYIVKWPVFRLQRGSAKSPLAPSVLDLYGLINVVCMSSGDLLIWRNFEFWSTNICYCLLSAEKKRVWLVNLFWLDQ